jgi:hypothetical protein
LQTFLVRSDRKTVPYEVAGKSTIQEKAKRRVSGIDLGQKDCHWPALGAFSEFKQATLYRFEMTVRGI